MSDKTPEKQSAPVPAPAKGLQPETQAQRWVKYGSNVLLATVLVIVIAGLLIYIAQRNTRRVDTTMTGVYSLKPQTEAVIGDLKDKITIVSLYKRTPPPRNPADDEAPDPAAMTIKDQAQIVADLLEEYQRGSKHIEVQNIDPVEESDKLTKLHDQLVADYGSQIGGYKDFLAEWDKTSKALSQILTAQAEGMKKLTGGSALAAEEEGAEVPGLQPAVISTVKNILPRSLTEVQEALDRERLRKYPDWKAAVATVKDFLTKISSYSDQLSRIYEKYKGNAAVAENVRQYMTENQARYDQMKKDADALVAKSTKLGELKVDQLEQALNVQNPILVLGPKDWRILQFNQIWPQDASLKNIVGGKMRPRFAGEQQVTAAIFSLTANKKPKLVFVRPGGEPVTAAGFPPFIPSGPLSEIAERMRQYNFEVLDKDLSGTYAMQAQMQQRPAAPEPTDEEIKDAIWVVLDMPRSFGAGQQMQGMPPVQISPKVKDHLDHGGSALIVFEPQAEDLKAALDSWGIDLHPEAMAVHQPVALNEGSPSDLVEEAKTRPPLFVLNTYGDHAITKPLKNLDSVWVQAMVVRTHDAKDATVTPLCQLDSAFPGLKVWGETDMESMRDTPTYDKEKDLAAPIYGMAASEKKGGGRVVVLGSPIMFNGLININDPALAQKQRRPVARFPGNGELAANSIFWLAHLEQMIAISPAAMDVSRISDMSSGALGFWRYGMILILLPALVIAGGLFVYVGRQD